MPRVTKKDTPTKMQFRLLRGVIGGDDGEKVPGDIIESDRDLAAEEPERFQRADDNTPVASIPNGANWEHEREKGKHGECIRIAYNHVIYEDGTEIQGSDRGRTIYPAPTTKLGKLRARVRFLTYKHNQEFDEFEKFKNECESQITYHIRSPKFCPSVPEEALEQLKAGKARIDKLREEVERLEAQLPENKQKQEQADLERKRSAEMLDFKNKISSV